jgi:hypothetical protein
MKKNYYSFWFLFFFVPFMLQSQDENRALHFGPGLNNYVQIDQFPDISNSQFTIEAAFKFDYFGEDPLCSSYKRILGCGSPATINRLEVGVCDEELAILVGNGYINVSSDYIVADDEWHSFSLVKDNDTWYIYVDGILLNTIEDLFYLHGSSLRIGQWAGSYFQNENWDGLIDEVRIWGKALTAEEIANYYNCQLTGNEDGLVDYYDFNQGIALGNNINETILLDRALPANNGVLRNFTLMGSQSNWVNAPEVSTCTTISSQKINNTVDVKLYPNPTSHYLMLETGRPLSTSLQVELYDQKGLRLPLDDFIPHGTSTTRINLPPIPNGVYLLKFSSQDSPPFFHRIVIINP